MPDFKPGQAVQLSDGRKGVVRFAGQTHFQVGEWVGVELEEKTGKNDGSVQGERYFDCPMGYGMFVKPMMVTILTPSSPVKALTSRKPGQPASSNVGAALASATAGGDASLSTRRSLNMPSPSPAPRPLRRPSLVKSPTKSPTKLLSGPPSAAASRTVTPSNPRGTPVSAGTKARSSVGGSTRTSMGPPAVPASRTARQSSISSVASRSSATAARPANARPPVGGIPSLSRPGSRRPSADSHGGRDSGSASDAASRSTTRSAGGILSPQPTSPVRGRTRALEKLAAVESSETAMAPPPKSSASGSRTAANAAANREVEDLKAKLKVLDRKRIEDRDKLKLLEKIQAERDKFEGIIQKLQQKYQPLQQENAEFKKLLQEAEARFESVETMQAEHDSALELAALDREMAEETAEVLKMELDALKQKVEELELEVDVLREENAEYDQGMTSEERASSGWLQMEKTNERLREALLRLRDITQAQEEELRGQIAGLDEDVKELAAVKEECSATKEKLATSDAAVDDLRQQLDNALGAEDMIEDLTERTMTMSEQIEELKAVVDDLENLKEINDELEANHVQNEKELQEDLDFKDSVIAEQARRAALQEESLEDLEYTLSRFRELVTNLQGDLEDMRASQAVTEGESEKLNDRSRAMLDLNMKLQLSAAKAQAKTIDLELRHLEAQEAEQHLDIVKLFMPDSYLEDQDSVLALLRFRRLAFKSNLLMSFIKERIGGPPHAGHEDDVFSGCDAVDKLAWVSAMCERFVNDMSRCSVEHFSKYRNSLHELEPVERALNGWIEGLRRDELKEKSCATELHRTVALMSHLAEVHISTGLSSFADDVYMKSLVAQSRMETAVVALNTTKAMVQRALPCGGDGESDGDGANDEMAQHFFKNLDLVITQTRSTKVIAGKVVRALEDLKARSSSLLPESAEAFERCEKSSEELAELASKIGNGMHGLLTLDEGRNEPFTYAEIETVLQRAGSGADGAGETDTLSSCLSKLRVINSQMANLAALATDPDQTQDLDVHTPPWRLRSQELKALRTVPVDAEEELRRLKQEHNEARRTITQRDEHLSTAVLKIETLEARMRDAHANVERISDLQKRLGNSEELAASLREDIEKQDRELKNLESERDKWQKMANDSQAMAGGADAAGVKAGQERAVATAREMDALKKDIESLQSAVRYLREDNRRARTKEQQSYDWLAEPLTRPTAPPEQRRNLIAAEGKDVLGELIKLAASATIFNLSSLPKDKLAWRPARSTAQHHAAKQQEDYAAWTSWQDSVAEKSAALLRHGEDEMRRRGRLIGSPAAQLQIRLPGLDGKMMTGTGLGGDGVQVVGSREWEALQGGLASGA
ncbi:hypothetical protein RJ55_00112 [Drechmeria coniospora]|nr:hypothetical protein RJ55_00112 [Drechmeria coniospora]